MNKFMAHLKFINTRRTQGHRQQIFWGHLNLTNSMKCISSGISKTEIWNYSLISILKQCNRSVLINVLCSSQRMAPVSRCKNYTVLKPQQLKRTWPKNGPRHHSDGGGGGEKVKKKQGEEKWEEEEEEDKKKKKKWHTSEKEKKIPKRFCKEKNVCNIWLKCNMAMFKTTVVVVVDRKE